MEAMKNALGDDLYAICASGDLHAIKTFMTNTQTTDPSYESRFSSLMYFAISEDQVSLAKFCLDNGTIVKPGHMKAVLGRKPKSTYILLLDTAAIDVNYYIPWFGDILSNVALENDFEWTRLCLDYGADPNMNRVDEHHSLLAEVAEVGSLEMAKFLIDNGAKVQESGAIVMAAETGKLDLMKILLGKGADINEIGIEHPTDPRYKEDMGSALHRAVYGGHADVVRLLIEKGADANLKDPMNRTSMDIAVAERDDVMIELLKKQPTA